MNRLTWLAWAGCVAALFACGMMLVGHSPKSPVAVGATVAARPEPEAPLVADPGRLGLGVVHVGVPRDFVVTVNNRGTRPARLVGLPSLCQNLGCVDAVAAPTTIAPHESARITCRFDPKRAGDADMRVRMFFDVGDRAGHIVTVAMTATVIDPQGFSR